MSKTRYCVFFPGNVINLNISCKLDTCSRTIFLGNVVNLNISYKLNTYSRDLNTDFTLCNCLFGAVKWIKNAYPDKYGYSGYGIGFNAPCLGRNVVICGV